MWLVVDGIKLEDAAERTAKLQEVSKVDMEMKE